ncbi:MAG TPA: hypothetical protein VEC11_07785 [Allosphingosinicella sp.]|nr:hypothetical protein [Allosphingosinicella sp.]
MRLNPIVERLKEKGFKRAQGVLELISLKAPPFLPAYYVVPETETAEPNRLTGGHSQRTDLRFGVVVMMEGAGANQDRTSDQLHEEEGKVIQAMLGWVHPDAADGVGCDYAGARMLSVSGSTLSWMVSFRTRRLIRKVNA